MSRTKSHAHQLRKLASAPTHELDPEDERTYISDSDDSENSAPDGPDASREHYEDVDKSTLRKPHAARLGPQYAGTKVGRNALDAEDNDDPFNRDFEDSEEEEVTSDEEMADFETGVDVHSSEEGSEGEAGTDLTDTEEEDDDEEASDDDERFDSAPPAADEVDRAELRRLMADDQKSVAATLSQSAKADAEKGQAVRKQRTIFDAMLNSRIKLQKALVATNSMLAAESIESLDTSHEAVEAAETAALKLWNNLNDLRWSLHEKKTGEKRDHTSYNSDDSLQTLWEETKTYESAQKKPRTAGLDFWASKTRTTTALPQARGRLQQPIKEQQLSDVLTGQLADMERLVAKTRVARSCAPVQAAAVSRKPATETNSEHPGTDTEMPFYDDADFYSTLLASLISQRGTETTFSLSNLSLQPWQAAREARTKKVVDTKASKGRKLRYNVHDKLVSFMAPEDRSTWGERQANELFGSLFGRKIELAEDANGGDAEEEDAEVVGLRLFGGK